MAIVRAPAYRLYIDESGDHTNKEIENPDKRFLGLTGVIIETTYYRDVFQPALEDLKRKHFPRSPDMPVILHRSEILNRKGPFGRLKNEKLADAFNKDILEYFSKMNYVLITVVIDKKYHKDKYGDSAMHPYHYCVNAMLERYCGFLQINKKYGDVLAESRGGIEDTLLKESYNNLYENGTYYRPASFFQQALTSKEIKLKPKSANIAGTQIADLLAHPIKQKILFEKGKIPEFSKKFGSKICGVIDSKHNRRMANEQMDGYGLVFLG